MCTKATLLLCMFFFLCKNLRLTLPSFSFSVYPSIQISQGKRKREVGRQGEERRSQGSEIMIEAYLKFGKKRKLRTDGDYREKKGA